MFKCHYGVEGKDLELTWLAQTYLPMVVEEWLAVTNAAARVVTVIQSVGRSLCLVLINFSQFLKGVHCFQCCFNRP